MGFQAAHWIQRETDLTGNEYLVALTLAIAVDDGNGATLRRRSTLVDQTHLSERMLKYTMAALNKKGVVAVGKRVAASGAQITNAYVLRGYVESLGLTVEDALAELTAQEQQLKTRPERPAYDFSQNGKSQNPSLFDITDSPASLSEGGTDDEVGGTWGAPQGAHTVPGEGAHGVPPYINSFILTLSPNSFSSVADATDAGSEEEIPFTDPVSLPEAVPATNPRSGKGRKKKVGPTVQEMVLKSRTSQILQAYVGWLGYEPASFGREARAAKMLGKAGWTDEQIEGCYRSLKAERFWSDKHLSLDTVNTNIAARLGTDGTNSKGTTNGNFNTNGRVQLPRDGGGADAVEQGAEVSADDDAEWNAFLAQRAA